MRIVADYENSGAEAGPFGSNGSYGSFCSYGSSSSYCLYGLSSSYGLYGSFCLGLISGLVENLNLAYFINLFSLSLLPSLRFPPTRQLSSKFILTIDIHHCVKLSHKGGKKQSHDWGSELK